MHDNKLILIHTLSPQGLSHWHRQVHIIFEICTRIRVPCQLSNPITPHMHQKVFVDIPYYAPTTSRHLIGPSYHSQLLHLRIPDHHGRLQRGHMVQDKAA